MGIFSILVLLMNKLIFLIALVGVVLSAEVPRALAAHPSCKLAVSKNGRCGTKYGNTRCAGNKGVFCSRWAWCGTSALHKKTHQAKFDSQTCGAAKPKAAAKKVVKKAAKKAPVKCLKDSKNGRCGKAHGNTKCGQNPKVFCSRWGWCGPSALHKKTHQAAYDGKACGAKKPAAKKAAPKKAAKKAAKKPAAKKAAKKGAKKPAAKKAAKKVVKKAAKKG